VCKSGASVREVHQEDEETFLGAVGDNLWMVDLKVNSQPVEFCIDTGAEVTVIPERVYQNSEPYEVLVATSSWYEVDSQQKLKAQGRRSFRHQGPPQTAFGETSY
jgi:hypothetical protein